MNAHIADEELERIISDLRKKIREGAAHSPAGPDSPVGGPGAQTIDPQKRQYALDEITGASDEYFLTHAYRCLLKREPDAQGLDHHARLLYAGQLNKADIAIDIANSPEARQVGTKLAIGSGTRFRRLVCNLPAIGRFVRIAVHLTQLNSLVAEQQRHHFHALALQSSLTAVETKLRDQGWSLKQMNATIGHLDVNKAAFADLQDLRSRIEDVSVSVVLSTGRIESSVRATLRELQQVVEEVRNGVAAKADVAVVQAETERLRRDIEDVTESAAKRAMEEIGHLQGELEQIRSGLAAKADVAVVQAEIEQLRREMEQTAAALMSRPDADSILRVNEAVSGISERLTSVQSVLAGIEGQVDALRARSVTFVHVEEINVAIHTLSQSVSKYRTRVTDIERRLNLVLEELRKRLPQPISEEQIRAAAQTLASVSDRSYVDFEDLYRGTREDIKSRQAIYLPDIRDVISNAHAGVAVLDLGCGRGEWLELLRENDIAAVGIDANTIMVEQSREHGLDARQGDAIDFLTQAKPNSVSVITGFHIIEHLPLDRQLKLIDEALRVLTPGGVMILETPNPANLRVGGCSFYLDPTHIKPLPAEQLSFLVESRGFVRARILNLHPAQPPEYLPASPEGRIIKDLLFGPQDYAVLAFKA